MATVTNQSRHTTITNAGMVFYGWLFLFTIPGSTSILLNQAKNSGSVSNLAKHSGSIINQTKH